jgi:cell division protease FtsH
LQSISDYQSDKIEKITYTEFLSLVDEGKVDTVYYSVSDEWMTITLLNDETKDMTREERDEYTGYTNSDKRRVPYPAYDEFRKDILSADTNMKVQTAKADVISILSSLISVVFPILMLLWLFKVMNKQMQGTTKHDVIQTSDIRFDDVIGHEEILDDVKFITELIKDPTIGDKVGAKVPKGILLSGEPGTGKTLIAKAIAGEAGVPFLYQNASSFIEMYVGVGAKRVRELFKIARENSPCIIFIDEIDSIGSKRDSTKGTSENEQTINALLQEMDGFTGREGIFVIAATNRADKLDKALVRSGRFDRQIVVNPPRDWKVRKELFEHYLNKFSVGDDIDIDTISKQVSGFTGADIAMVCNEASIIAVMQKKDYIDTACIEEAIDKKIFKGNRSKKKSHEQDRQIVAYHEAGHAVMNYIVKEPMARATIIGTTSGVGGVVFGEDKDTQFMTDRDFLNRVLICYGGRASEEIKFSSVTTGASNDITQATQLLTQYIERYGFDRDFGLLDVAVLGEEHLLNSTEITNKLSKMSKELYSECLGKLKENYNLVEALATKLLDVETLSGEEIYELFSTVS